MMSSFLPAVFGENLMDVFNDFDRNFFRGWDRPEHMLYGKNASRMMKTDVKETDTGYELDVDLPGFKKEEIKLELENGYLTISTEKTLENKAERPCAPPGALCRHHVPELLCRRLCHRGGYQGEVRKRCTEPEHSEEGSAQGT